MDHLLSYFPSDIKEAWLKREKKIFKKGEFISSPINHPIYLLVEGVAHLFYVNPNGKECVIDLLQPGDLIGILTMFSNNKERTQYVRTLTPVMVIPLSVSEVKEILLHSPKLAFRVLEYVTDKFERTLDILEQVAYGKVEERLLYLLERLAGEERQGYRSIPHYLTHRDLAAMIGSTRETITSLINKLLLNGRLVEKEGQFWFKV